MIKYVFEIPKNTLSHPGLVPVVTKFDSSKV